MARAAEALHWDTRVHVMHKIVLDQLAKSSSLGSVKRVRSYGIEYALAESDQHHD